MKVAICLLLLVAGCHESASPSAAAPAPQKASHDAVKIPASPNAAAPAPQKPGTDVVKINVTLSGARAMPEVVKDLQQHGMTVDQQLTHADVVTGQAPTAALAALRSVNGVKAVELDQPIQLPPDNKPQ